MNMFSISRRINYLQGLKCVSNVRAISGRVPHLLSNDSIKNVDDSDGNKKDGYGEKEIFLLGPIDVRTPLPGNTGIPPLSMYYIDKIRKLPEPAGEKCEVISDPLPEERYQNTLTQVACVAVEKALSTPNYRLECTAYSCPYLLKKDFLDLFPSRNLCSEELTVVTLCQKTENNMSEWSESGEAERKSLETCFLTAANAICAHLKQCEYWADFIHPNSGKPYFGSVTNAAMFETDLRYRNFGFNIEDLGCCRIISHVMWGTNIFVGAIFTNAAIDSREVQDVLNKHNPSLFDSNP